MTEKTIQKFVEPVSKKIKSLTGINHLTIEVFEYSKEILQIVEYFFQMRSNYHNNLIFYFHNHFEIFAFFESNLPDNEGSQEYPDQRSYEIGFVRAMILYKTTLSSYRKYYDFSKIFIFENGKILLNINMTKIKNTSLNCIINKFNLKVGNNRLSRNNIWEVFEKTKKKYLEELKDDYAYHYSNASFEFGYIQALFKSSVMVRSLKVSVKNFKYQEFIKLNIFKLCLDSRIKYFDVNICDEDLTGILKKMFSDLISIEKTPVEAVTNEILIDLRRSNYNQFVFVFQGNDSKNELTKLMKIIKENNRELKILLIDMTTSGGLNQRGIKISDSTENEVEALINNQFYIETVSSIEVKNYIFKYFAGIEIELNNAVIEKIFNKEEIKKILKLCKQNKLKLSKTGAVKLSENYRGKIKVRDSEKIAAIKKTLKHENSEILLIKLMFLEKDKDKIISIIDKETTLKPSKLEHFIEICSKNIGLLNDFGLLKRFIKFLVSNERIYLAEKILNSTRIFQKDFLALQTAHIFWIKKEYDKIKKHLLKIKKCNSNIVDEVNYLKFCYNFKKLKFQKAEKFKAKINDPNYLNQIELLELEFKIISGQLNYSDRLTELINCFKNNFQNRCLNEAKLIKAKMLKKNNIDEAEILFKQIFKNSSLYKYQLLSAYISIDLGNFYYELDKFNESGVWYQRGYETFDRENNQNGKILALSNLMEIEKIIGNWETVKIKYKEILLYDKSKNKIIATAYDYFNLAELSYLQNKIDQAFKNLNAAKFYFNEEKFTKGIVQCEILILKINFLFKNRKMNLEILNDLTDKLNTDQLEILSIFKILNAKKDIKRIMPLVGKIKSKYLKYEMCLFLIRVTKSEDLLILLKSISYSLNIEGRKNYFYYEYFYIMLDVFINSEDLPSKISQIQFLQIYWFFKKNGRYLSPKIEYLKKNMEEVKAKIESNVDIAELIKDSRKWRNKKDILVSINKGISPKCDYHHISLFVYDREEQIINITNKKHKMHNIKKIFDIGRKSINDLNILQKDVEKTFKINDNAVLKLGNCKFIKWSSNGKYKFYLMVSFLKEDYVDYNFKVENKYFLNELFELCLKYYNENLVNIPELTSIIGRSNAIVSLKKRIIKVSKVGYPILISGESGTGKELVARAVAAIYSNMNKTFFSINSAVLPENLMEEELFGYSRGAFTGANNDRIGLIEAADNGTLFIDEIGELPLKLQAKLLRVLQENEIKRLGENVSKKVNVRFIFATNNNLKKMVENGGFREDLYYRINDLELKIPSLAERVDDIPILVKYFLRDFKNKIEGDQIKYLTENLKIREWKGNVRELKSYINRFITFYPEFVLEDEIDIQDQNRGLLELRDDFEKQLIKNSIKKHKGNKQKTADELKISRNHLYNLIQKYSIEISVNE